MNNFRIIPLLCFLLAFCSCAERQAKSPYPPAYFDKQIAVLTHADIAADVASAIARGDRRFLLNVGYGGSIPGVINWSSEMREKFGTRILDGTGDMVFGQRHQEFKKVADDYARKYNQLLFEQIGMTEKQPNMPSEGKR